MLKIIVLLNILWKHVKSVIKDFMFYQKPDLILLLYSISLLCVHAFKEVLSKPFLINNYLIEGKGEVGVQNHQ